MNKKYFTKYLPVEGEIKIGNLVKDNLGGEIGPLQVVEDIKGNTIITDRGKYQPYKEYLTLYKFSLCSRDIQVGDKLRCYKPDMSEWIEAEFIQEINGLVDGNMVYTYQCKYPNGQIGGALKQNFFKVIGEISPEALSYVKEGDEFEESEVRWSVSSKDSWGYEEFPITDSIESDEYTVVSVKGPCGHFH